MSSVRGLDRADRTLLERLNAGGASDTSVPKQQVNRLVETGLVQQSELGGVYITLRGQLELARWRFRKLPKPRYVVVNYKQPRQNIWRKLFK